MDTQIVSALIGAGATLGSIVLTFSLNGLAKKISEKKYREKHNIIDISGSWNSKWMFPMENGEDKIIECTNHIKMKGKNQFEGEGRNNTETWKRWHYSINGTIDEMGYLNGTWQSLGDGYKGAFLLKLRPSLKSMEGHVISVAFENDTRAGRWVWEIDGR